MEILIWIIILLLCILSLIGVVIPVLPDTVFLWAAFLLSFFIEGVFPLPVSFWIGMGFITLLILGSDFISNAVLAKKYGASSWAVVGAVAGLILGIIIFGPLGIIVGPFLMVFIITFIESKDENQALKSAWGTVVAFFSSVVAKIILQLIMIIWYFLIVI